MRVILQRVSAASVVINKETINEIATGYVLLIGFCATDDEATVKKLATKLLGLRIWDDVAGKMNEPLDKDKQEILAISQFTLYANVKKGKRPSFVAAMNPTSANVLYEYFVQYCRDLGYVVKTGQFGAHMDIHLVNDGPVTLIIDSDDL